MFGICYASPKTLKNLKILSLADFPTIEIFIGYHGMMTCWDGEFRDFVHQDFGYYRLLNQVIQCMVWIRAIMAIIGTVAILFTCFLIILVVSRGQQL